MKEENIYAVVNGFDRKSSEEAIELSKKHSNIFATIGFHPSEINDIDEDYVDFLEKNYKNIVAIGEIGLDYYYEKDNKEKQKELLRQQLSFAEKHNLPVIIHNREATNDIYEILKEYKLKGIMHAFSGSYEMAQKFIEIGFKLGIGGVITFKNSNLASVMSKLRVEDIVLETDSPYLTPEPKRGKKNSPLELKHVIKFISDIKGVLEEEICSVTSTTTMALFDLKL